MSGWEDLGLKIARSITGTVVGKQFSFVTEPFSPEDLVKAISKELLGRACREPRMCSSTLTLAYLPAPRLDTLIFR